MRLNKQQRLARDKAIRQAAVASIKANFTGDGSRKRAALFLRRGLMRSATWTLAITCYFCGAMVIGLTLGPDHEVLLKQFHAWMVATPVEDVLATAHQWALEFGMQFLVYGVLGGFGHSLVSLVEPATNEARDQFHGSIA